MKKELSGNNIKSNENMRFDEFVKAALSEMEAKDFEVTALDFNASEAELSEAESSEAAVAEHEWSEGFEDRIKAMIDAAVADEEQEQKAQQTLSQQEEQKKQECMTQQEQKSVQIISIGSRRRGMKQLVNAAAILAIFGLAAFGVRQNRLAVGTEQKFAAAAANVEAAEENVEAAAVNAETADQSVEAADEIAVAAEPRMLKGRSMNAGEVQEAHEMQEAPVDQGLLEAQEAQAADTAEGAQEAQPAAFGLMPNEISMASLNEDMIDAANIFDEIGQAVGVVLNITPESLNASDISYTISEHGDAEIRYYSNDMCEELVLIIAADDSAELKADMLKYAEWMANGRQIMLLSAGGTVEEAADETGLANANAGAAEAEAKAEAAGAEDLAEQEAEKWKKAFE